jgi:hypothetical protein
MGSGVQLCGLGLSTAGKLCVWRSREPRGLLEAGPTRVPRVLPRIHAPYRNCCLSRPDGVLAVPLASVLDRPGRRAANPAGFAHFSRSCVHRAMAPLHIVHAEGAISPAGSCYSSGLLMTFIRHHAAAARRSCRGAPEEQAAAIFYSLHARACHVNSHVAILGDSAPRSPKTS